MTGILRCECFKMCKKFRMFGLVLRLETVGCSGLSTRKLEKVADCVLHPVRDASLGRKEIANRILHPVGM